MSIIVKRPLAFIDIEATGNSVSKDRIVEIAILKLMPEGEKEMKTWRMNPGIPIPPEIVKIHRITDEDVRHLPPFKAIAKELNEYLDNCDIAGYNSDRFDIPILVEEFLREEIIFDTKSRKFIDVFRIFALMEKRDLTSAYKFYCDKDHINAHSAEADITATYEVLCAQLQKYNNLQNDIDYLHDFTREDDYIDFARRMVMRNGKPCFNFGKHKGKKISDVLKEEPQYYDWIQKGDFPLDTKQKLKEIRLMMKINTH